MLTVEWWRAPLDPEPARLSSGGVLLIDDYGHFLGAKKAVDEYFAANPKPFFHRVDYSARLIFKQ